MEEQIAVKVSDTQWGWAYSTQPVQTPTGLIIAAPEQPDYTGTVAAIKRQIKQDRTYRNLGGACHCDRWFYNGKAVVGHEWFFPENEEHPEVGRGRMGFTHDMRGFDPERMTWDEGEFKILLAA